MPFGVTAKTFQTIVQKLSDGLSKLHSSCPEKRFLEEKQFLENLIAFLFTFGFYIETLKTSVEETSSGLPFLPSTSPEDFFEGKKLEEMETLFFQTLSEKCSDVDRKFSAAFWKVNFTCRKEHLQEAFREVWGPFLLISKF